MNPVPLDKESVVFPLDHSLFLIKLHLTLIITLRMYTGWTQADIQRRNCEWDLNQGRLEHLDFTLLFQMFQTSLVQIPLTVSSFYMDGHRQI